MRRLIIANGGGLIGWLVVQGVIGNDTLSVIGYIAAAFATYQWFGNFMASRDKKTRGTGGSFVASPAGIELVGSETIAPDRIHRLVLRNAFSNVAVPHVVGGVIAGGTGMVGAGAAVGAAVGNASGALLVEAAQKDLQRNTAIGYKLDVEFGGSAKTLASGMTETTAYGLMQDVGKVLGM